MRLTELNPQFVGAGGCGIYKADGTPVPERKGVGLMCDCPCGCGSSLFIPFSNPLDGGDTIGYNVTWTRTGDTFDTLTLTPSIRRIPHNGSCGWHGFITNGEIKDAGVESPGQELNLLHPLMKSFQRIDEENN